MNIVDQSRAEYIDHLGTDLTVVNSARVSFDKTSDWEQVDTGEEVLPSKDVKLINFLARHGHWTPFAHPQITIRETVPIFVARQRFKHMVGFVYNEISRRYVDDEPEFFVPDEWRGKPENAKQGSSEVIEGRGMACEHNLSMAYQRCKDAYEFLLDSDVCPEQARMVLPQGMMTSYYVTGSLAAWARAYNQRIDSHAQKEIQDLAKIWGEIIEPLFPVSWAKLTAD